MNFFFLNRIFHKMFYLQFYSIFHQALHNLLHNQFKKVYNASRLNYNSTLYLLLTMLNTVYYFCINISFDQSYKVTSHCLHLLLAQKVDLNDLNLFTKALQNSFYNTFFPALRENFALEFINMFENELFKVHRTPSYSTFNLIFHQVFHRAFSASYSKSFRQSFPFLCRKRITK